MDVKDKYDIYLSPPYMGGLEAEFVKEALVNNETAPWGSQVDAFEKEFAAAAGIDYTLAVSSGTGAMHLALNALGVDLNDEVVTPSMTHIGGVSPILYQKAVPVFIDSDRETWNMDPDLLAEELEGCRKRGRMPKAVIPTDLYGQCADLDRIIGICASYDIPVVSNSSDAVGSTYHGRFAGNGARAAVYSFNAERIITTSCGGMLASDDPVLIGKARELTNQGKILRHDNEHTRLGYNYLMSNILAAVGRGQLKVLSERVKRKREIFNFYQAALAETPGIEFMPEAGYGKANRWLTVILINPDKVGADRETVRRALEAERVEARPVWKPMHLQPLFTQYWVCGGSVSEEIYEQGLCLPSGPGMAQKDLEKVTAVIIGCGRS